MTFSSICLFHFKFFLTGTLKQHWIDNRGEIGQVRNFMGGGAVLGSGNHMCIKATCLVGLRTAGRMHMYRPVGMESMGLVLMHPG